MQYAGCAWRALEASSNVLVARQLSSLTAAPGRESAVLVIPANQTNKEAAG